jgi:hypothetical protein
MNLNYLTEKTAEQLSYDLNCSKYDFFSGQNTVTESILHPGRRRFSDTPDIFRMATMGGGNVISCAPELKPTFKKIADTFGDEIFSPPAMSMIAEELRKFGVMPSLSQAFLPKKNAPKPTPTDDFYELRVFDGETVKKLYAYPGFENALCRKTGKRRDVMAVCAFYENELIAVAGASNDSDIFWQIGVDVDRRFRNNGIAKTLVSILTEEIEDLKKIPYYSVSPSNIPSLNTAMACGYYPAIAEARVAPAISR